MSYTIISEDRNDKLEPFCPILEEELRTPLTGRRGHSERGRRELETGRSLRRSPLS